MIEARVTLGIYDDLKKAKVFRIRLGALPRIGETILLPPGLREEAESVKKKWGLDIDARVNYVKCIAYDEQPTPVLMLSFRPDLIPVECIREDNTTFSLLLPTVPRIGEVIITPAEQQFFVDKVVYAPWGIYVALSRKENGIATRATIENDGPVPVEIANVNPLEIYSRQLDRRIDVNVTNTYLNVESNRNL